MSTHDPSSSPFLQPVERGQEISASQWNELIRRVARSISGPDVIQTDSGIHIRARRISVDVSFCVVWKEDPENKWDGSPFVNVKFVSRSTPTPWDQKYAVEWEADSFVAVLFPGWENRDVKELGTDATVIGLEDQVQLLFKANDGVWYMLPMSKEDFLLVSLLDRVRFSDCDLKETQDG